MPDNTDVPTKPENVYRQIKVEGVDDLNESGVVRNAGSAGKGRVRKYGDRVYWTQGKEGEFHNVQPGHAVLEAPLSVVSSRVVTAEDIIGIHVRNEAGEVENRARAIPEVAVDASGTEQKPEEGSNLEDVRNRLGLSPKE